MPAALAIPAAISGAASIGSSIIGANAAGKAAKQQSQAGMQAANLVQNAVNSVNPNITAQAQQAANWAITNAQNAGADVKGAAGQANDILNPWVAAGQGGISTL